MGDIFPVVVFQVGSLAITDTVISSLVVSAVLVVLGALAMRLESTRTLMELAYDALEHAISSTVDMDVRPLAPIVLTQWLFIGAANLAGALPGVASPTRDLSLAAALAAVALLSGHLHAFRVRGIGYLKQYIDPNPLLLPLNLLGEVSRTIALALRLFGNMMSGSLVGAIMVYLAGAIIPVPLMLLSVLTAVVQAYIFGVLTLVFAASSVGTVTRAHAIKPTQPQPGGAT